MHYIAIKITQITNNIDEQQVTETNDIFDLAVTHPPPDIASQFATTPGINSTHN